MAYQSIELKRKKLSREIEVSLFGLKVRYKSVAKAPLKLKSCEHLVDMTDKSKEEILTMHGNVNGSIKIQKGKM